MTFKEIEISVKKKKKNSFIKRKSWKKVLEYDTKDRVFWLDNCAWHWDNHAKDANADDWILL